MLASEYQIFWMLVKKAHRRDDVGRVYLAIQAALAFGRETVDVIALLQSMQPEGQPAAAAAAPREVIGADGLAYFYWLYETELVSPGEADTHQYRFRRRTDGREILTQLATAPAPKSLQFQQTYERQRRTLEKKRASFLATMRW